MNTVASKVAVVLKGAAMNLSPAAGLTA